MIVRLSLKELHLPQLLQPNAMNTHSMKFFLHFWELRQNYMHMQWLEIGS